MTDVAIRCEGLSKQYRIGKQERYKALRDTLTDVLYAPFRRIRSAFSRPDGRTGQHSENTFWALDDVSFEVKPGEVVGVIGRNGAGKSTLLKILSRITEPTRGHADIHGRVGSLLEVGTGFNPELTGRENIFLNGAILGMKRAEIVRKFDEIVAFSEVDKFLDTPVKHYSSGMHMRLAFAVAAHLEPEILLVDEVLAVGDAVFQKKCLGKMEDVAKEGRTVLFVSHNMTAVQALCTRGLLINAGRVLLHGKTQEIVQAYLSQALSSLTERSWEDMRTAPGNDKVRLRRASVRPAGDGGSEALDIRRPFTLQFEYWNLERDARLNLSLHVYNEQGTVVFNTAPINETQWHGKPFPAGLFRSVCHIPGDLLNDGLHRVELMVVRDECTPVYRHDDILVFDLKDSPEVRGAWHGRWAGAVRPNLAWQTEHLDA